MKTRTEYVFELQHDSQDGLMECVNLTDFLRKNLTGFHVRWESCKSDFGLLVIEAEKDSRE